MWKLIGAFIIIAALGIWLLLRGGEIDLSGESHDTQTAPKVQEKEPAKKQ